MQTRQWTVCICILQVILKISFSIDYCGLNNDHVLCGEAKFHSRCGDKLMYRDYSKDEIEIMLEIHNEFRSKVASGFLSFQGQIYFPEAADMEELVWDEELAKIASGSVKRCLFEHTCQECRRSAKFNFVGENLNDMTTSSPLEQLFEFATVDRATEGWRNEKDFFPPSEIQKFPLGRNEHGSISLAYGHFTQMIWANTTNIGCAKIGFVNQYNKSEIIISCLYGEAGNIINEPIYRKGNFCTACRGNGRKCSQKYPGLCVAVRNLSEPNTS
ncbi:UNVERIFIED_CONTAM: hypothetical protein RMT77_007481 [Armadillidium vulgare]